MPLRDTSALILAMIGLAAMSGDAAAQTLSPPTPYTYPQGGYRGAPGPGGIMNNAPDEDDDDIQRPLPPRGAPYVDRQPYPTDPNIGRDNPPYPADPRYSRQMPPAINAPEPYPEPNIISRPPGFGPMPPYEAPGSATMRPDAGPTILRPPGMIQAAPGGAPAHVDPARPTNLASLPPEDQPEEGEPKELPVQFRRQVVNYQTKEPAGTIVIDTPSTFLYLVNGDGTALRYGIGVGREGFTWTGTERVTRMAEWPDWHPPSEMIERQPYLPRFMAGGPGNPMGARALYLGKTVYRVHGTNQPSTIGKFVSSGCIRMLNEDVEDLYTRVKVGTKVVVLSGGRGPSASNAPTTR